jgi:hypothetical protein
LEGEGLNSVLEILVTGEVSGNVQFWYLRNSDGLQTADWKHDAAPSTLSAERFSW